MNPGLIGVSILASMALLSSAAADAPVEATAQSTPREAEVKPPTALDFAMMASIGDAGNQLAMSSLRGAPASTPNK